MITKIVLLILCFLLGYLAFVAIPDHGQQVQHLAEQVQRMNDMIEPTAKNFLDNFDGDAP